MFTCFAHSGGATEVKSFVAKATKFYEEYKKYQVSPLQFETIQIVCWGSL